MYINHFKCEMCFEEFHMKNTKEEQDKEFQELFQSDEEQADLCESCFIKAMDILEPRKYRYEKYIGKN